MLPVERFEFTQTVRNDITDTGQPAPCKFHTLRVDVTRLHKSACLLRAPARVTGVDQAALLIHELVEIAPRTGEKLTEIVRRNFHHLTPNLAGHSEIFTKDEGETLTAVKETSIPAHAPNSGFVDQQRQFHRHAFRIGEIQVCVSSRPDPYR